MRRCLPSPLTLALLLAISQPASALAVMDMRALSRVGQPVQLEVVLDDLFGTRVDDLAVTAASAAEHQRLGLQRPEWLDQVRFELTSLGNGTARLLVQGERPVSEPAVSFLIKLQWPGHVRLQQIAATLPDADSGVTIPVTAPVASPATSSTAGSDAAPSASAMASGSSRPVLNVIPWRGLQAELDMRSVPMLVRPGDSLSRLAQAWAAPDLTLAQRQQLLAQANPDAFIDGSIHRLRVGATLVVPRRDAVTVPTPSEAQRWLSGDKPALTRPVLLSQDLSGASTIPASGAARAAEAAGDAGEPVLTILTPDTGDSGRAIGAADAEAGGDDQATAHALQSARLQKASLLASQARLRSQLETLAEEADAQRLELEVLDGHLRALEDDSPAAPASDSALADAGADGEADQPAAVPFWRQEWFMGSVAAGVILLLVMWMLWPLRRHWRAGAPASDATDPVTEHGAASATDSWTATQASPVPAASTAELGAPTPEGEAWLAKAAESVFDPDEEYDFLADGDSEAHQTRLDLALAYLDMQETGAARVLLQQVLSGGNPTQQARARALLERLA